MIRLAVLSAVVVVGVGCGNRQMTARPRKPGLPPMMQQQVLNAVNAGDGNVRVRKLRERIVNEPKNVAARLELAAEYAQSGYPELEIEHCRIAVERFPESVEAVEHLAKALRKMNAPDEAAGLMVQLVAGQPKPSAETLSWTGIFLDEADRLPEGETMHRRAVDLQGRKDYLHNNLGYNLLLQKRFGEAADEFRRALELNHSSATARNNLGRALLEQSKAAESPADAIVQFQRASDLAIAHNNVATVLYELGNLAGARKELETALEYRRDLPQILENLRMVAAADGKPIEMPRARATVWQKVGHGLKVAFGTPEVRHKTGSAEAAR
jgi:Flp pilus assembly protein TadD